MISPIPDLKADFNTPIFYPPLRLINFFHDEENL